MVARIWHGWTTPEDAESYERLLREKIFPGIAAKGIKGYKDVQLLRRSFDDEIEFITIMRFENWDSVKEFAGKKTNQAYVPAEAQKVLSRFDKESQHYEIKINLTV